MSRRISKIPFISLSDSEAKILFSKSALTSGKDDNKITIEHRTNHVQ